MQKFIIFKDTVGRHQFINCLHLIRFEVKEDSNHPGMVVKFFLSGDKDIEWGKRCNSGSEAKTMISDVSDLIKVFLGDDVRILNLQ